MILQRLKDKITAICTKYSLSGPKWRRKLFKVSCLAIALFFNLLIPLALFCFYHFLNPTGFWQLCAFIVACVYGAWMELTVAVITFYALLIILNV